ncbi:hypothetical protein E2562_035572 [Oryza meyeriana var. granulata]|uniref:Uncharacterized protein n=1 Tax=Oryza meyeriana var. granulata TaxID=110450 RepID=A0A6G1ESR1_9ORYZ|nr:hypothetical protein E2562_035572 [Oryza meyeriana var. granulata]
MKEQATWSNINKQEGRGRPYPQWKHIVCCSSTPKNEIHHDRISMTNCTPTPVVARAALTCDGGASSAPHDPATQLLRQLLQPLVS